MRYPRSEALLAPGTLRVGIWDTFWRRLGRGPDASITGYQQSPQDFEWIDLCDDPRRVDVVMATWGAWDHVVDARHPRRILYLQETTESNWPPSPACMRAFDLVLSNDQRVLDALPDTARFMTLFGIRMPPAHYASVPAKSRTVSLMGSARRRLSGNALRWRVHDRLTGFDAFGFDGRPYWKAASLGPYRFQIAIENARYPSWCTEKLWDAFALETVPVYWGGVTDAMLMAWGFRPDGVLRWSGDLDDLQEILDAVNASPEEMYAGFASAVAHNRRRVLEIPCGEVVLRRTIADYFHLI